LFVLLFNDAALTARDDNYIATAKRLRPLAEVRAEIEAFIGEGWTVNNAAGEPGLALRERILADPLHAELSLD